MSKQRTQEISSELQKSISPEAKLVKELVGLLFEDVKHNLISMQGDDLLRQQGAAQLLQRMLRELTKPSPVIKE